MSILFIILSFIFISVLGQSSRKQCLPFGVRLALGNNFYNQTDPQIISITFNTKKMCLSSFAYIQNQYVQREVQCKTKRLSFKSYITYIHRCSIDFLNQGDHFSYMVNGWNGNKSEEIVRFKNDSIKSKILHRDSLLTKILVFADWGYQNKYQKLDLAFSYLVSSQTQPDAIFLNGDYAYDLSSNNGKNYEIFLKMLEMICPFWPCIFNIGNHEHNTRADFSAFSKSFQNYGLASKLVTSLNLGTFTLLISDPYDVIYGNFSKEDFINLNIQHIKNANKNKPIIAATHYHMACGGGCNQQKQEYQLIKSFKQLIDTYIDYDVMLYLGSHVHSYERYYPYAKSGQFIVTQSPYKFDNNSDYLISIVEGVGGNRQAMSKYKKTQSQIKIVHPNNTGYGILTVNNQNLLFEHYIAKSYEKPVDSFEIIFSPRNIRQQIVLNLDKDKNQ